MFDLVTSSRSCMKDWMERLTKTVWFEVALAYFFKAEDFKRSNPTWEDKRNDVPEAPSQADSISDRHEEMV